MSLRDELFEIYRQHGELTPGGVVDAARDPKHPLHDRFEWDDAIAGEAHRLDQARQLIRMVRVRVTTETEDLRTRQFVSVARDTRRSYMPVEEVRDDPFLRKLVLNQALREWKQLWTKYQHLKEFLDAVQRDVAG